MAKPIPGRAEVPHLLEQAGGLRPGAVDRVAQESRVPAADVYGVATFYSLIAQPEQPRVCSGLSCRLAGSIAEHGVSCLGQCDRAPAALDADGALRAGPPGDVLPDDPSLPINLGGADRDDASAVLRARELGVDALLETLERSGLQGRGGAGFPAHLKWRAVRAERAAQKYLVVNADEGEPGTFKDRELLVRRPRLLLEGIAIAAEAVGASQVYVYVRGELRDAGNALQRALLGARDLLGELTVHVLWGHGAYICGEETALLEAIEGRRGHPRLKPPFPTQSGLWGAPTLVHNVETLALVPDIVLRGGERFRALGRKEPGTKLYCVSGHVVRPGVYELPLGSTLDELVAVAGGYVGRPRAFSPGGASSGFLSMQHRALPLDAGSLSGVGSMLGSAGVVVLNDSVDLVQATLWQQRFFEAETCGQCAPCRVGCGLQRQALERFADSGDAAHLADVPDVAWEMEQGSICGLGMVASQPLLSAMKHFPEDFS